MYSPSENKLEFNWAKCIGCSAVNCNYRPKISCCCTRQSLNLSGLTASNYKVRSPTQTYRNITKIPKQILRIIVNAPWYLIDDVLHHDFNVPYVRDETKRFSQRYADRMEEHPTYSRLTHKRSQNNTD